MHISDNIALILPILKNKWLKSGISRFFDKALGERVPGIISLRQNITENNHYELGQSPKVSVNCSHRHLL